MPNNVKFNEYRICDYGQPENTLFSRVNIESATIHNSRYIVGSMAKFKFGLKGDVKQLRVVPY